MAGAGLKVTIEVDDRQARRAFARLARAGLDMEPVFWDIGEYLLRSHEFRFQLEIAPDGTPWAPLAPRTVRRKGHDRILTQDGFLRRLVAQPGPDELLFGTNRIYGATHQFGDEDRGIPARPFIGLSGDDRAEIRDLVNDYLADAARG